MSALFATYTSTSKRLGLAFEDGRIHGVVDGIALQMWFGMHSVHVGALLPRPAPVDLSVAPKTLIGSSASSSAVTATRSVIPRSTSCSRRSRRTWRAWRSS